MSTRRWRTGGYILWRSESTVRRTVQPRVTDMRADSETVQLVVTRIRPTSSVHTQILWRSTLVWKEKTYIPEPYIFVFKRVVFTSFQWIRHLCPHPRVLMRRLTRQMTTRLDLPCRLDVVLSVPGASPLDANANSERHWRRTSPCQLCPKSTTVSDQPSVKLLRVLVFVIQLSKKLRK